ncbi:MAG: VWA domain-containing protein [Vicinamibacteria bacterium]
MPATLLLSALVLAAASPSPSPSPTPPPGGTVILFLIDNSASLPPLDPDEKRVAALEKMFTFLQGQPYRLVLFGGRHEIFVDDVSKYRNNGQWTDFYFAIDKAREITETYPKGTEFRMILLTDALLDPGPGDWDDMNVPKGEDLKAHVVQRILGLLQQVKIPLYVILVGDVPKEGIVAGDKEQSPELVLQMVRAANGSKASPLAQSLSSFFKDDGVLLKKFVFRVAPHEGLKKVEPVVRRIVAPSRPGVELQFLSYLVLPLSLFLALLLGILVRSFPGAGDVEIIEISQGVPVHVAADKLHKLADGGWGPTGLSLVADVKAAAATLTYQTPPTELTGVGLDTQGLDGQTLRLLPLGLEDLRRALEAYSDGDSKEEKIYSLNLDYMAKNFEAREAERILTMPSTERLRVPALDFLRAKAHLLTNEPLRRKLTEPRAQLMGYGKGADRKDLAPGTLVRIGRYGFIVKDVNRGGRKDARVVLYYDRIPSLLGLKTFLPGAFQRLFRFRRSSQRVVS